MHKYIRWIIFGVIALVLVVLIIVVGINKNLRQKIELMLLERFIRNKVADLKDKATIAKTKAESGKISAMEAEQEAIKVEADINEQKTYLQHGLVQRGFSTDEIANYFNNINI